MSYMNYDRQNQPTKMDQHANTNLDQDVANSRSVKYQNSQAEVKQYLYNIFQRQFPNLLESKYGNGSTIDLNSVDLMAILKDGEVLCKLGSLLSIPTNPTVKFKNSKMPFIQMENISFFLSLCELIDLSHDEIFQTIDLFESKDPYQVVITLMSFSRIANSIDAEKFPKVIGPKTVKVKPPVPVKPFKLRY